MLGRGPRLTLLRVYPGHRSWYGDPSTAIRRLLFMRWSQLHIPTLREDPADADAASHRLLLRAGFVRQLAAGHYSMLPCIHPAEIWERSGRLGTVDVMFRLKDRKGTDTVLGFTHEEIFTTVATELASYRELPQFWYQFQTKFRDEARPKSGLLRVREFTMKDSYS